MAEDQTLLKTQKNRVFKNLQAEGLEPANFSWVKVKSRYFTVSKLNYLDGKYYFLFTPDLIEFSPGEKSTVQNTEITYLDYGIQLVKTWSMYLKREIEAPDLWAEMEKYRISVSLVLPEQVRNESIPAYEAEEIASKLHALAGKIDELFELGTEQSQFVHSKLNYLAEAAKRQLSLDWVHTSIGVCITIAMSLAMPPDKTKELWQLMKSLIGPFLHLIGS